MVRMSKKSLSPRFSGEARVARVRRAAGQTFVESLESRQMLALLGVAPLTDLPLQFFNSTGRLNYDVGTGALDMAATPTAVLLPTGPVALTSPQHGDIQIHARISNTGAVRSGVNPGDAAFLGAVNAAGDDLIVNGAIDLDNSGTIDPGESGVILSGELVAFGFQDSGPGGTTDQYDFRFLVTGGILAPLYAGRDIGVVLTSENSTFADSFGESFEGHAKGTLGPTAGPQLSSIGGYVYYDANNNGLFEGAESPIPGTTVTLTGTNDAGQTVTRTTTTDGTGAYQFNNLRPGKYELDETQPAAYLDGKDTIGTPGGDTSNDRFSNISLPGGYDGVNNNFGELLPASIGGYVYYDANNNGVFEGSESPIPGTTVTLTGTDDLGNPVSATTTTGANGGYNFTGLRPGNYQLNETQPSGYLDGKDTIGTPGGATTNDQFAGINLPAGFNGVNNNFGEILASSIGGYVYYDANNNGVFAGSESPIPGTTVTLTGTDDLGNPVSATTTTGASGGYLFSGLRPGTYRLNETQPVAYLDGKDTIGTPGGTTSNDQFSNILLPAGFNGVNNNFGEILASSIAGNVYYDANNNGVFEGSETGIGSVTVTLIGTDDLGNPVSRTTTTNGVGAYSFTGLRPGVYRLNESQPAAYLDGKDTIGTPGGVTTNDQFANINLPSGFNGVNNNFGELLPASLAGNVYYDLNNNGVFESGESGIPGTTVTLTGTDDLGNPVSRTTTTNSAGAYSFTGLRPGAYRLNETQPAGYNDGIDTIGTPGGTTTNDQFANINLPAGFNGVNNNFGEIRLGSIRGTKFLDETGNGLTADDGGLGGVVIYIDANNNGVKDSGETFATTAADGTWAFNNLTAGTYRIREIVPVGYVRTAPTLNDSYVVNVGAGQTVTGINFANAEVCDKSVITGYSFLINGTRTVTDLRGNTNQGDEVTVIFTVANNVASHEFSLVSYTAPGATFDANTASQQMIYELATGTFGPGTHQLTVHIPDCYYQIDFVCGDAIDQFGPAGSNIFYSAQGRLFSADNDGTCACVINPNSIAGNVFLDSDNDGYIDSGERGIPNVLVTLTGTTTSGQAVTMTRLTDSDGKYRFGNLASGSYTVTETQPTAFADGIDRAGSLGGNAGTNNRISSIQLTGNSNGINYNFGERQSGCNIVQGYTATIGFWQNPNGQRLIESLNGGSGAKNLGNWLAATFPNLYGANSGYGNSLAGKTNAQIADIYVSEFNQTGSNKLDAQVMALAFAAYVTSSSLAGGSYAAAYGFMVTSGGIGSRTFNIGTAGSAFGVSNYTTMTITQILARANSQAVSSVLWNGNTTYRNLANSVFDAINNLGDIG